MYLQDCVFLYTFIYVSFALQSSIQMFYNEDKHHLWPLHVAVVVISCQQVCVEI